MSTKIYNMTDTWRDNSVQYTSIKMNVNDINSTIDSILMDLQVKGMSKFAVNKLGKITWGTIDIPKVNQLEDAISVLAGAGLSQVDLVAPNTSVLATNTSLSDDALAIVYRDPTVINNDYYIFDTGTGTWTNTGIIPSLLEIMTPRKKTERTFYVSMNGAPYSNTNHGQSVYKPLDTVSEALALLANTGQPGVVIVYPGEYVIPSETVIPPKCALYGYDLRVTKLTIADDFAQPNNMFLLSNGCKVRGFTFAGLKHEPFTMDAPPKKGYAFAFKPGEYITRSPYIADCSSLHSFTYEQMTLPIDREAGNPLMPLGQGNLYADGSVLDEDSPLRSVVVDSFTSINPNGVGYAIVNDALVQLVSVFTNWSRVGVWAHQGGQVTITNSNCTFGDYAFASTGFRYVVKVDGVANTQNLAYCPNFANGITVNIDSIVDNLMNVRYPTVTDYNTLIGSNPALANLTSRDTYTLLRQLAKDFNNNANVAVSNTVTMQNDTGTTFFIQGLFTANGDNGNVEFVANTAYKQIFIDCFEQVREELKGRTLVIPAAENTANAMVDELIDLVVDVVGNTQNYTTTFRSRIEASGEQFSYAGAGVNYNSLPYTQRGTSEAPDPKTAIYKADGGVVFATFSTERGDTYLGEDIRVDFERSVIEGQAFSRGVQNITLPLIVGIGG